jgi:hypothetical protein
MTRSNRERIAKLLEQLSQLHPEWRFGQLVANVSTWAKGPTVESVWDVEDEEFIKAAEEHIRSSTASAGRKKAV